MLACGEPTTLGGPGQRAAACVPIQPNHALTGCYPLAALFLA
jgi:hypothetical protein